MRQLTPEQQAAVPADQPIGTLAEQGLQHDNNGTSFDADGTTRFVCQLPVTDWRQAVSLRLVSRSRYGTWEPFRKASGTERSLPCNFGTAWATDRVHILICTVDGLWISRSSQVVTLRLPATTPGLALSPIRADRYLKQRDKEHATKPAVSLADEYASLVDAE